MDHQLVVVGHLTQRDLQSELFLIDQSLRTLATANLVRKNMNGGVIPDDCCSHEDAMDQEEQRDIWNLDIVELQPNPTHALAVSAEQGKHEPKPRLFLESPFRRQPFQ